MIFILNEQEQRVGVLDNEAPLSCPYFADIHTENIETGVHEYSFSVPASHDDSMKLVVEGSILIKDLDGKLQMFRIKEITETSDDNGYIKEVYTEHSSISELLTDIVRPTTLKSITLENALSYVLDGTLHSVGNVSYVESKDVIIDKHITVLEAINMLMEVFEVELQFETIFKGGKVYSKLVHLQEQRGNKTNKLFSYGKDLIGVERKENSEGIVTALIGVGKGDTSGEPLLLTDHVYSRDGYYTEDGKDYVENDSVLSMHGKNGKHIFGLFMDDTATTQSALFYNTMKKLKELSKPRLSFTCSVVTLERIVGYKEAESVRVGDTIIIQDYTFTPALVLEARIKEVKRSYTAPENDEVTLGDYRPIQITSPSSLENIRKTIILNENRWNVQGIKEEEVKIILNEAITPVKELAEDADVKAGKAQTDANTAIDKADNAQTDATNAQNSADTANEEVAKREMIIYKQPVVPVNPETNALWIDTSTALNIMYRYNGTSWKKLAPTTPQDIGAVSSEEYTNAISGLEDTRDNHQNKLDTLETAKDEQLLKINSMETELADKLDSSVYSTKVTELEQSIADKVNSEFVEGKLVFKADADDVYTITEVNNKLADKAEVVNVYSKTEVDNALNSKVSSTKFTTDMNGVITDLQSHETRIEQNETDIASKVSSTAYTQKVTELEGNLSDKANTVDVNTKLSGKADNADVSALETSINTKLNDKADSSAVSIIETRVADAETAISQNDTAISLKADSDSVYTKEEVNTSLDGKASTSDVSALETEVNSNSAELLVQAGQIASKVESSTYNTKVAELEGTLSDKADSSDLTLVEERVADAETAIIQSDKAINLKAEATDVYTKTQVDSSLSSKADSSDVALIENRIENAEAEIGVHAGEIVLKASQSALDTISGELEEAQAELSVQAGKIASKVESSDYTTKVTEIESNVSDKADKTYVNTELSKKQENIPNGSVAPLSKSTGDLWIDTSKKPYILKQWDGLSWVKASPTTAKEVGAYSTGETDTKLNGKADTSTVNAIETRLDTAETSIEQTKTDITFKADASSVYTKGEVNTSLNGKADNSDVTGLATDINTKLSGKVDDATFNTLETKVEDNSSELSIQAGQIASKVESSTYSQKVLELEGNIADKAEASNVYTKGEVNTVLAGKADDSTVSAIETRVSDAESRFIQTDNAIALKANSDDVYTKTEVNNSLSGKADGGTVSAIEQRVTSAEGEIVAQAGAIDLKANSTDVYTKTQMNTQLSGKADNATVANIEQRVSDNEGALSVHDTAINARVTKETYDIDFGSLTNRVESAEGELNIQAGQISSKVSESDFNGNKIASLINQSATTIDIEAEKVNFKGSVTFSAFDSATQSRITSAESDASGAKSTANTANTTANSAKTSATNAVNTANSANTKAGSADTKATNAVNTANTANTNASSAKSTATSANSTANSANTKASDAQNRVNSVEGKINNAVTTIDGTGVTVQDGSFYLKDSVSGLRSTAVFKPNLIADHSFESLVEGGTVYSNSTRQVIVASLNEYQWSISGTPRVMSIYQTSIPKDMVMFGLKSPAVNSSNYLSQYVQVSPSTEYTVSWHIRRVPDWTAGTSICRIRYYSVSGTDLGYEDFEAYNGTYNTARFAGTFRTPSNCYEIRVYAYAKDTSWVLYDGFQLVEGNTPAPYNPEDELTYVTHGMTTINAMHARNLTVDNPIFTDTLPKQAHAFMSLENGWRNYGGNFQPARYTKTADGVVHLSGLVRDGSIGSDIATLPAGCRPNAVEIFSVAGYNINEVNRVYIYTSGRVTSNTGSSSYVSLSGISFLGEN